MKSDIHPQLHLTEVVCACGNVGGAWIASRLAVNRGGPWIRVAIVLAAALAILKLLVFPR